MPMFIEGVRLEDDEYVQLTVDGRPAVAVNRRGARKLALRADYEAGRRFLEWLDTLPPVPSGRGADLTALRDIEEHFFEETDR